MLKTCFPPVVNTQTQVIILGSLPGEASLAAQQYYAHPRNQFWSLLAEVIGVNLYNLPYPDRLQQLQRHTIGLWDVLARASRKGSLDAAIREKHYNNLVNVLSTLPQLKLIAFNGQTAGKAAAQLKNPIPYIILPSSSPAYTLSFAEKKEQWMQIKAFLKSNI